MKKIQVKTILNETQRRIVFALAKTLGIKVHFGCEFLEVGDIDKLIEDFKNWNYLTFGDEGIAACRSLASEVEVSHADFLLAMAEYKKDLIFDADINSNYTATVNVTAGTIQVGCQTFKIETIKQLMVKINKVKRSGKI
jgi:hypothetical protein